MVRVALAGIASILVLSTWACAETCSTEVLFASRSEAGALDQAVLEALGSASESLDLAVDRLTNGPLREAVTEAHRRGVRVRVLLASGGGEAADDPYERLSSAGVLVRWLDAGASLGHPFAVVDRRMVLTGSYPWSQAAMPGTAGTLIRLVCPEGVSDGAAHGYLAEFERLWEGARDGSPSSLLPLLASPQVRILLVDRTAQCIYLLNPSETAVDTSGWSLHDFEGQYAFPAGTLIPANDPYRICIDLFNPSHDAVHGLYLDPDGDELFLMTPAGLIVDEMVW